MLPALVSDSGLSKYLAKINSFPMLTAQEERRLAVSLSKDRNVEAAQALVKSHLRLVVKVALQFRGYGLPLHDLISEGNIGLIHAVKKFDIKNGARLATYAVWWIKATIQDYILKSWSLVKMGSSALQKKLFFGLRKTQNKIACVHGEHNVESRVSEISDALGVKESDVRDMGTRLLKESSIDKPLASDMNSDIKDIIRDESDAFACLEHEDELAYKKQILIDALGNLSEREKDILKARRLCDKPLKLKELSKMYNISQERVRQIEGNAFKKVKEYCSAKIV